MALPIEIKSLDEVDAALRPHYEKFGDAYRLAFDGLDKLKNEARRRQAAQARIKELEAEVASLRDKPTEGDLSPREQWIREQARRLAPFEPGSAEWQAEHDAILTEMQPFIDQETAATRQQLEDKHQRLQTQAVKLQRESVARTLLQDLARPGCEAALLPLVVARVGVEEHGDDYVAFALDAKGQPTTRSIESLKDEFRQSPAFAPLVRGATEGERADHKRKVAEMIGAST